MSSVLIVSPKDEFITLTAELLSNAGISYYDKASGGSDALRKLGSGFYDFVIIGSGLKDCNPFALALNACEKDVFSLLICQRNSFELYTSQKLPENLIMLIKPVSKQLIISVAELTDKMLSMRSYHSPKVNEADKDNGREIVDKAKQILISMLEMPEPVAHRFIQKNSMNLRIPIYKMADLIIKCLS